MPPQVRGRAATAPAAPAVSRVKIGDLSTYQGGFLLPKGDYALFFGVRNHAYTKGDGSRGQEMLGVMVTAYPLTGGEAHEQFYGLGKKAITAYQPDPSTPAHDGIGSTGLIPIPGAPAVNLSDQSNWGLLLKSLYDCGLPEGVFEDDFSTLDGVWVTIDHVLEPESRRNIKARTAQALASDQKADDDRGPQMVPIVVAIKDDGQPWNGTGGMPDGATEAPKPEPAKVGPKPVAARPAVAAKKVAPPPPAEEAGDDEGLLEAAVNALAAVFSQEKFSKQITKVLLRTETFKAVKSAADEATADAVLKTFFDNEANLASVLEQVGYKAQGAFIKPVV